MRGGLRRRGQCEMTRDKRAQLVARARQEYGVPFRLLVPTPLRERVSHCLVNRGPNRGIPCPRRAAASPRLFGLPILESEFWIKDETGFHHECRCGARPARRNERHGGRP